MDLYLTLLTKINSKWIKDLNVRNDTINILEENIGRNLSDINRSNIFFDPSPRVMEIKTKINKWDLIKLKSSCTAKERIKKMERQHSEWEKIFANDVTDKGLVSKQLMRLNIIKTNNPIKKLPEELNRHFSEEDIQMAKRHLKRCSTSLIIREMQIKTTMRYHLKQSEQLSSKNPQTINSGEGIEKGTLLNCWWECKLVQSLWRTIWSFLMKLKNRAII